MSEWQGKVGKHNPDVQKQNMPKEKTQWNFKKVISGVYNGYICFTCLLHDHCYEAWYLEANGGVAMIVWQLDLH